MIRFEMTSTDLDTFFCFVEGSRSQATECRQRLGVLTGFKLLEELSLRRSQRLLKEDSLLAAARSVLPIILHVFLQLLLHQVLRYFHVSNGVF